MGTFVKAVIGQAAHYTTNNIMFTMGSDFQYEDAREWYKNLDKLIYYVNKLVNLSSGSRLLTLFLLIQWHMYVCRVH